MQINETMDLEKKIKQFEKDYHNGPANGGLTQLWKIKMCLIYIYIVVLFFFNCFCIHPQLFQKAVFYYSK